MNKPHKHCDMIKAWADGYAIQSKIPGLRTKWQDTIKPFWYEDHEYRIKPVTLKYKTFLWKNGISPNASITVLTVCPEGQASEPRETWKGFIRWIDNDWQEIEI